MLVSELKKQLDYLDDNEEIAVVYFSKFEIDEEMKDCCWTEVVDKASSDMEEYAKEALEANLEPVHDCACAICEFEDCVCDEMTDAVREE